MERKSGPLGLREPTQRVSEPGMLGDRGQGAENEMDDDDGDDDGGDDGDDDNDDE